MSIKKFLLTILILLFSTPAFTEVLFYQNFDDDTVGSYLQVEFNADWNTDFMDNQWSQLTNSSIITGANARSGNSLKITYPEGEYGGGAGAQWRNYITGYDELYFGQWVKFDVAFDFVNGGKLNALCGGT